MIEKTSPVKLLDALKLELESATNLMSQQIFMSELEPIDFLTEYMWKLLS